MGGSGRANAVSGWLLVLAVGCSAHHGRDDLVVGRDPKAGSGAAQAGAPNRTSGVAGTSASASGGRRALTAAIQNREGVTLDVVTVGCARLPATKSSRSPAAAILRTRTNGKTAAAMPRARSVRTRPVCSASWPRIAATRPRSSRASPKRWRRIDRRGAGVSADAGIPSVADASTPDAGSEPTPPPLRPLCIENGSFEDDPIGVPWFSCRSTNQRPAT